MGTLSQQFHEEIGEYTAMHSIDKLITVGLSAAFAAQKAIACGMKKSDVYKCESNDQALNILEDLLVRDDVVLFKASRGMRLEEIINQLRKNNEKITSDKLEVKS